MAFLVALCLKRLTKQRKKLRTTPRQIFINCDMLRIGFPLFHLILSAILLLAGCTTPQIDSTQRIAGALEPHATVAILISTDSDLEREAVECITTSLRDAKPGVRFLYLDEFRQRVFYYGYPENENDRKKYFTSLGNEPALKQRVIEMGIRYVISIYGATEQKSAPLGGFLGGAGGGFTWFGMAWDRKSRLEASIFDLQQVDDLWTVRTIAEGHPWFICFGIGHFCAPIGAAAFTESTACKGLAEALAAVLTGRHSPEPVK